MNKRTYNYIIGIPLVLFMLCSPLFIKVLIDVFSLNHWLDINSAFTTIINLVKSALVISLLLLGLYFKNSIFLSNANLIKPTWALGFGVLFTLMVYIPAAASYFTLGKINSENYVFTNEMTTRWKENALSNNCDKNNNRILAQMYYNETGQNIKYLDENNDIVLFQPTNLEVANRKSEIKQENEFENTIKTVNDLFYLKLFIAFSGIFIWLVISKLLPPKQIIINS